MKPRPRFSIRTLVILITLACCYAACWGPTKKWGVGDVARRAKPLELGAIHSSTPIVPLVVRYEELKVRPDNKIKPATTRYYFWFFGYIAKLPW